ncbi:hypothetical protein [Halalkalibacillus sediminis]|uniref:hypothetical protein n=1 Tax=Halalkalibacillus sediminis TaxID=2018042 RepID=UPI00117B152C|nr:hypothetical protein [Halalkalibacillus sediminis]
MDINAQDSIQNLIQISLYEFELELNTMNLNYEKQFKSYEYANGNVTIGFYLLDDELLKLELNVETLDEIIYRFSTEMIV